MRFKTSFHEFGGTVRSLLLLGLRLRSDMRVGLGS
jgi:hypothetical protein